MQQKVPNVLTDFHKKTPQTDYHTAGWFLFLSYYKGENKWYPCFCPAVCAETPSRLSLTSDTVFLVCLQITKCISSKQAQSENFHTFQVKAT